MHQGHLRRSSTCGPVQRVGSQVPTPSPAPLLLSPTFHRASPAQPPSVPHATTLLVFLNSLRRAPPWMSTATISVTRYATGQLALSRVRTVFRARAECTTGIPALAPSTPPVSLLYPRAVKLLNQLRAWHCRGASKTRTWWYGGLGTDRAGNAPCYKLAWYSQVGGQVVGWGPTGRARLPCHLLGIGLCQPKQHDLLCLHMCIYVGANTSINFVSVAQQSASLPWYQVC